MEKSIFTRIINGEIPSHKVYEDEDTYAFMDIHPIQTGMVLVVPKEEVVNAEDLPEELYLSLMRTVRKVSRALRKSYPERFKIGVQIEGLDVPHVHVKIFPFNTAQEFHAPAMGGEPDHEKLAAQAEKIRSNM